MTQSFKEMAHILGLANNPHLGSDTNERWALKPAHQSTKARYNQHTRDKFNPGGDNLNFYLISNHSTKTITDYIAQMKPNEYMGLLTGWEGHAYSLHAIKGRNQVIFIYVNRGEAHNSEDSDTVKIFPIPIMNNMATDFASQMIDASRADQREIMASFLEENEGRQETRSSDYIAKTDQGRDNCTIANSNISWHLQLAAKYMQEHRVDFLTAYRATDIKYQEMRRKDQINAFQYLLNNGGKYPSDRAYFYDYMQALEKFEKGLRGEFLVEELQKNDPRALAALIRPLENEEDFRRKAQHYVKDNQNIPKKDEKAAIDELLRVRGIILSRYNQFKKTAESDYDSEEEYSEEEHHPKKVHHESKKAYSESEEEVSEYEEDRTESEEDQPEKPWVQHDSDDEATRADKNSQFIKHAKDKVAELRAKHQMRLPEDSDDEGHRYG